MIPALSQTEFPMQWCTTIQSPQFSSRWDFKLSFPHSPLIFAACSPKLCLHPISCQLRKLKTPHTLSFLGASSCCATVLIFVTFVDSKLKEREKLECNIILQTSRFLFGYQWFTVDNIKPPSLTTSIGWVLLLFPTQIQATNVN